MAGKDQYEPTEEEQGYINKVTSRFTQGKSYWNQKFDWWDTLLRDYRMELDLLKDDEGNSFWPYESEIFPPYSFIRIEVEIPLLVGMLLDHDPCFAAIKNRPDQDPDAVKRMEDLLIYQLRNRKFKKDAIMAVMQVAKLGTQIWKVRWKTEKETILERRTIREFGLPVDVEEYDREIMSYDGPDAERVPYFRFYIDPATPQCQLQKAGWIIEEDIVPWDDFMVDAEKWGYKNIDYLEYRMNNPEDKNKPGPQQSDSNKTAEKDNRALPKDSYGKDVHILYHYDRSDYIVMADVNGSGWIPVKTEEFYKRHRNGKYPYVPWHNRYETESGIEATEDTEAETRPSGFYPIGDLEPLHGMQQASTQVLNQRLDNVNLMLRGILAVVGGVFENEEDIGKGYINMPILWANEEKVETNRLSDFIHDFQIPDYTGASFGQMWQILEESGDDAISAQDAARGKADDSNKTATGIMATQMAAVKRHTLKATIMADGMSELIGMMSDLNVEMISPDTIFYVTGNPEPLQISPEDVIHGVAFVIRTIPPYSKALISEQALQGIAIMEKYCPQASVKKPLEVWLQNQEWVENAEEFLPQDIGDYNFLELLIMQKTGMTPEQQRAQMQLQNISNMVKGGMTNAINPQNIDVNQMDAPRMARSSREFPIT